MPAFPLFPIIVYLTTLLLPEGTEEFTINVNGWENTFYIQGNGSWKSTNLNGQKVEIREEDGYVTSHFNGREMREELARFIVPPEGTEFTSIKLVPPWDKNSIKVSRSDQRIIFTVSGDDLGEVNIEVTW